MNLFDLLSVVKYFPFVCWGVLNLMEGSETFLWTGHNINVINQGLDKELKMQSFHHSLNVLI